MRIKTYQTRSIPTALAQIKKDLGPGAVILNTKRHVNRRFFGLLPSVAYEVTAAVDQTLPQPAPEEVQEKSMATNTYEVADTPPRSDGKRERFTPDPVEVETLRSPTTRGRQEWGAMLHNLHADVEEIKRVVLWSESIASSAEADFKKMFLSLIPTPLQTIANWPNSYGLLSADC